VDIHAVHATRLCVVSHVAPDSSETVHVVSVDSESTTSKEIQFSAELESKAPFVVDSRLFSHPAALNQLVSLPIFPSKGTWNWRVVMFSPQDSKGNEIRESLCTALDRLVGDLAEFAMKPFHYPLGIPSPASNSWKDALRPYVKLDVSSPWIIFSNDSLVVSYDKYPKARYHLLAIPKLELSSIWDCQRHNLDSLQELVRVGHLIANSIQLDSGEVIPFRLGFHAKPSLWPIHMHIIVRYLWASCHVHRVRILILSI
jgi:diadenosine tetraphosphate (Ap4A) HIT family hydrolase